MYQETLTFIDLRKKSPASKSGSIKNIDIGSIYKDIAYSIVIYVSFGRIQVGMRFLIETMTGQIFLLEQGKGKTWSEIGVCYGKIDQIKRRILLLCKIYTLQKKGKNVTHLLSACEEKPILGVTFGRIKEMSVFGVVVDVRIDHITVGVRLLIEPKRLRIIKIEQGKGKTWKYLSVNDRMLKNIKRRLRTQVREIVFIDEHLPDMFEP